MKEKAIGSRTQEIQPKKVGEGGPQDEGKGRSQDSDYGRVLEIMQARLQQNGSGYNFSTKMKIPKRFVQ